MFVIILIQIIVCVLILRWLLKQKAGEPFSRKAVVKLLLWGAVSYVATWVIVLSLNIDENLFAGFNPLLTGFLTALVLAALLEELVKYAVFRLAVRKNAEVVTWHDAVIAAVTVSTGFLLMEDIQYTVFGGGSFLRAILPCHLLFQGIMGYFYGKAKVMKKPLFHVLSVAVPILWHTAFDMFLISMKAAVGEEILNNLSSFKPEDIAALPYFNLLIPMLAAAIAVMVISLVALIIMFVKIKKWREESRLQEPLEAAE